MARDDCVIVLAASDTQLPPLRKAADRLCPGARTQIVTSLSRLTRILEKRNGVVSLVVEVSLGSLAESPHQIVEQFVAISEAGAEYACLDSDIGSDRESRALFALAKRLRQANRDEARQKIRAGIEQARKTGTRCGAPRKDVDLSRVAELLTAGSTKTEVARMLGVSIQTLRRRLAERPRGLAARIGKSS